MRLQEDSSMEISFRPFDAGRDWGMVAALLAETHALGGFVPEDAVKDRENYLAAVAAAQKRDPAFAAMMLDGDEAIGFVHVYPVAERPEIGFISFDCLVKERRGRGLGKNLLDYAVRAMKDRGCTKLLLDVAKANAQAVAFYRKHGFEVFKERGMFLKLRLSI